MVRMRTLRIELAGDAFNLNAVDKARDNKVVAVVPASTMLALGMWHVEDEISKDALDAAKLLKIELEKAGYTVDGIQWAALVIAVRKLAEPGPPITEAPTVQAGFDPMKGV